MHNTGKFLATIPSNNQNKRTISAKKFIFFVKKILFHTNCIFFLVAAQDTLFSTGVFYFKKIEK